MTELTFILLLSTCVIVCGAGPTEEDEKVTEGKFVEKGTGKTLHRYDLFT